MTMPHTRTGIREGLTAYLASKSIPNLARVYSSAPRQQEDPVTQAGQVSAANAYLTILGQDTTRRTMGPEGSGYFRRDDYIFHIQIVMYSKQELTEDAERDNDAIIDGLKAAILADETLGGVVSMAAEGSGPSNGADFQVRLIADEPIGTDVTLISTEITFCVTDYSQW
jgi:hypothetical protein